MKTISRLFILCLIPFVYTHLVVPDVEANLVLEKKLSKGDAPLSRCEKACIVLSSHLNDAVYVGTTGDNFDFWDAKMFEISPACRVEPSDVHHVSFTLKTLVSYRCHFVVKSGGHERGTPGSSNHENGVIIDLVRMKALEVADDRESVTIGSGWRWGNLYEALEHRGLMVLGGRLGEVGVAGLLLGGGISFHTNWRGLACDSILSYEIVLPDAAIATVSQDTQPELYRILRGGGATSFGIVTSFTLEAFPQRQLWYGSKAYSWDVLPGVLEANHQITTSAMDLDPHISVMNVFMCYPKYHVCIANILLQHADHNSTYSWPRSLQIYEDIEGISPKSSAQVGPMSDVTNVSNHTNPVKYRTIYATFTYEPSVELEKQLLAIFREEAEHRSLEGVTGWLPGIIMHPLSTSMLTKTRKHGGNAFSSVADHDGPLTVLNIAWQWNEKEDDAVVYASYYRAMARLEQAARNMGLWHPYKYVNYAEASQNMFEHISESEMESMKSLQKQIDPSGIFANGGLARGPFKLGTAGREPATQAKLRSSTFPPETNHKDEL